MHKQDRELSDSPICDLLGWQENSTAGIETGKEAGQSDDSVAPPSHLIPSAGCPKLQQLSPNDSRGETARFDRKILVEGELGLHLQISSRSWRTLQLGLTMHSSDVGDAFED